MSDKVIIREENLPGIDQSILDFYLPPIRMKVTKKMFKRGLKTFIGLAEYVRTNEVIQVGNLGLKYRIVDNNPEVFEKGYIHQIKRIDGFNITSTDINAIIVGKNAIVIGRRSFQEKFEQIVKVIENVTE